MKDWYVSIGFKSVEVLDADRAFDFTGKLGGAPMSVERDGSGGNVSVYVTAKTLREALETSAHRVKAAAEGTIGAIDIFRIEAMPEEDFDREVEWPLFPEVVGFAEIARLADVTRQSARDYAKGKSFPAPVIVTAQGPLFAKASVEAWLETRPNRRKEPITV